jgi:predicted RNase H-like HicB family nuclease
MAVKKGAYKPKPKGPEAKKAARRVREKAAPAYGHAKPTHIVGTAVPEDRPETRHRKERGMKFFSFEIVIEKEAEDSGYYAYSPTLPGCFSNGRSIEEARRNIRLAVEQHVASLRRHSCKVPQNERLVHVEALTVGVPG